MLIGLAGRKGAGKDTVAERLVEQHGFIRIALADPLKMAVANLFEITREQVDEFKQLGIDDLPVVEVFLARYNEQTEWTFSWREFLQRFGTEMGRGTFGEDFWTDIWQREYDAVNEADMIVDATDVRYENEARRILSLGGWMIEVHRPGYVSDGHASEAGLDEELIDGWIDNNGTVEDLYNDADLLMEDIISGRVARI